MEFKTAILAIGILGGFSASAQTVHVPVQNCAGKFDGFENKIIEAMNRSESLNVGIQAKIAYNKLGYGASPAYNQSPQDFMELEELGWKRLARKELASMVVAGLETANTGDPQGFRDKMGELYPLYKESYAELRDKVADLKNKFSGADLLRERAKMRNEMRRTLSAYPVARALYGRGPNVKALLSEFWFNHFNLDGGKSTFHALDYEKMLSRRVCGTFLDLLQTSATHPAMLIYLDNFKSTKAGIGRGLNENYARELMELYTLGVGPKSPTEKNSPYDQETVTNVAKLLTGWGVSSKAGGPAPSFVFRAFNHDKSRPEIMSVVYADGLQGGLDLLKTLASHPRTQRNVCTKLAKKLLGQNAPKESIDRCVSRWGTYGNLTAMYKSLISEARFWSAANYNNSVKSPIDLVASGARAMGYHFGRVPDSAFLNRLVSQASLVGVHPRRVAAPTGYSSNDLEWIDSNYQAASVNFGFSMGSDVLPLELDENKKLWGLKKEDYILKQKSPQAAVDLVLFQSLFTKPEGYWSLAGRSTLREAVLNADYDRVNKVSVPARTINSLLLGSHMFIRK